MRRNQTYLSPTQRLHSRYTQARYSLFLLVALTVINLIILCTGGTSYFLFSAYIPYSLVVSGMFLCGMLPAELLGLTPEEMATMEFFPPIVFVILLVIALFILAMYAVMALMAGKQRYGWLIAALVFVSIDTFSVLSDFTIDTSLDLLFHIAFIVELSLGINAAIRLRKMPADAIAADGVDVDPDAPIDVTTPTEPIVFADPVPAAEPTDAPLSDAPAADAPVAEAPAADAPATASTEEGGVCGIPDAPSIPDAPEIQ